MRLGAGRAVKTDQLDYETGIVFYRKVGDLIQKGDLLAEIYSNEKLSENLLTEFKKNVKIDKEEMKVTEILKIIT
ncbi:pyrimidine nucleoside phosphorylase C-terminal domain protein [Streptococcus mutans]|nr:pyrimidine nucleoside phosphorylase C-terminal domain protein [Streptococcus mutans]